MRVIRKKLRGAVMASIVLAVMASCHWGDISFSASSSVPREWTRKDTVDFQLPVLKAGRTFHFVVDVRHTEAYTYRDLWVLLRHNVADSLHWQTDTLRCPLYSEDGYPLGKGLTGLYTVEIPYGTLVSDGSSQAQIQLVHCIADSAVVGISDIGIRIEN